MLLEYYTPDDFLIDREILKDVTQGAIITPFKVFRRKIKLSDFKKGWIGFREIEGSTSTQFKYSPIDEFERSKEFGALFLTRIRLSKIPKQLYEKRIAVYRVYFRR